MIDTHAHLNFAEYKDDLEEVIKRCADAKVGVINVGSQYSTSARAVEIAEKYENMWAAIGLHPIHLESSHIRETVDENEEFEFDTRNEKFDAEKYKKLAESKKVVAIGETGIDLFHNSHNREEQEKVFEQEIDLAAKLDLPIIVHCRKANNEVIEILQGKKEKYGSKLRGVVHCFSGNLKQANKYIDLGFYLGFNGIITFARDYDKVLREIALERILLETDCPYLAPVPYRGKRNEPTYVSHVASQIAQVKNVSFEKVAETTSNNAQKLFGI